MVTYQAFYNIITLHRKKKDEMFDLMMVALVVLLKQPAAVLHFPVPTDLSKQLKYPSSSSVGVSSPDRPAETSETTGSGAVSAYNVFGCDEPNYCVQNNMVSGLDQQVDSDCTILGNLALWDPPSRKKLID